MLCAVVLIALVASATALKPYQRPNIRPYPNAAGEDDPTVWLLPTQVTPSEYDLKLTTHIENFDNTKPDSFKFDGIVTIKINVASEVQEIVLHAAESMTFGTITLKGANPNVDELTSSLNATTNKLTLIKKNGDPKIPAGDYDLTIPYTGVHGDDMHGFYRSFYVNEANETKWLVTTQFEAYDARRAFPCFDEPQYKALYTVTILVNDEKVVKNGYGVLSNMPSDGITQDGEFKVYKFQKSAKKISSYLVAFVISDFVTTDPTKFEGDTKEFRTWGQKRYIDNKDGDISQTAGPAALDIIYTLTGVNFGYPKLDQVGIPDFSAGAMENWGLVTYRERLIFYNPLKNPTSQKQSVVTVTTHELGHQWFGDLVTLHWWSDIWLNEGFATFFEYHASAEINTPSLDTSSWKIVSQFAVEEIQAGAFATDAQPNSRPLTKPVYRPGDIDANFDNIAYSKGGSVIRMWMHALGKDNFYKALNKYLTDNTEKVGTPELLLQAFEDNNKVPNLKPTEDFKGWHTQAGYPVVNVTVVDDQYVLTQERYLVSGQADPGKWTIPITYATDLKLDFTDTSPQLIFKSSDANAKIAVANSSWILLNKQQVGYYRVNYDDQGWDKLIGLLLKDPTKIDEINRAQLIDDSLWLARATKSYVPYYTALNLTMYLANEKELIPWKTALNGFSYLYGKLAANADVEPKLRAHITTLLEKRFNELTLTVSENDSHTTLLLRSLIASWACKLELESCVSSASDLFTVLQTENGKADAKVHPDVMSTVICTGVRSGDQDTWNYVWSLYQGTTDNSEQTQYLSALGCASDAKVINGFLNKLLDANSGIRKQDLSAAFSSIYNGNPTNVALAFEFLQQKYVEIANWFGGLDPLGGLLTGMAAKLGTEDDVKKITDLSKKIAASDNKNVIAARVSAAAAVDIVTSNKDWLDQKQDSIKVWVDEHYSNGASTVALTIITLVVSLSVSFIFSQ